MRNQLSLIETWAQVQSAAEDYFGEGVAVGTFGPDESAGGTGVVGKGYVGVPGHLRIMQFNVGPNSSGKNLFPTP